MFSFHKRKVTVYIDEYRQDTTKRRICCFWKKAKVSGV